MVKPTCAPQRGLLAGSLSRARGNGVEISLECLTVHTDVRLPRITDQTICTEAVEQSRNDFAPCGDHLRELFLPNVGNDPRAFRSRLSECVHEEKQRTDQPDWRGFEREALKPTGQCAEALA